MKKIIIITLSVLTLVFAGINIAQGASKRVGLEYENVTSTKPWIYATSQLSNGSIRLNTRPRRGNGGAVVRLYDEIRGEYVASKTFPYFVEVSDLVYTYTSRRRLRIEVYANQGGDTVSGILYLTRVTE